MKVLLVYHGGATAHTRPLYRALAGQPSVDRLTVVVPERVRCDPIYASTGWLSAEPGDSDGYELLPVRLNDPADYGRGFDRRGLGSALRAAGGDVVHVLDEPFSNYLLQVIQLVPLNSRRSRVMFYGFENRPLRLGRRRAATWRVAWRRTAGGAAASSEAVENVRRAGYPSGRPVERIFWGVPTEIFSRDRTAWVRDFGNDATRIVGYVGRLSGEKGLLVLAAAMLRLPADVHCLLVGAGPLQPELELLRMVPELRGRVHFKAPTDAAGLAGILPAFDVLVLPSLTMPHWKEQYGRVLTEAMASGVPVVGSDSGAIPEVIGEAGLVVPEGDPAALAAALDVALFDESARQRLIEAGARRVERELSVSVMSARLVSLYHRIAAAC
jgi:glycosyltransferase involved in cell wall biosynthesis